MPGPLKAIAAVSPGVAARIASPLVGVVGPRIAVRPDEQPTMDQAQRSDLTVRGRRVAVYEWGHGPRVVLLVHGWRGRAAQFAGLVRELRAEGYRVVAFDAPGSGESAGRTTDLGDMLEAERLLQARYGSFAGVVGHSFGALAALAAIHEGLASRRVVGVASIPDAATIFAESGARFGLDDHTLDLVAERFQARTVCRAPLRERFSGLTHPVAVPALFVHDRTDLRGAGHGIRSPARGSPGFSTSCSPKGLATLACSRPTRRSTRSWTFWRLPSWPKPTRRASVQGRQPGPPFGGHERGAHKEGAGVSLPSAQILRRIHIEKRIIGLNRPFHLLRRCSGAQSLTRNKSSFAMACSRSSSNSVFHAPIM